MRFGVGVELFVRGNVLGVVIMSGVKDLGIWVVKLVNGGNV